MSGPVCLILFMITYFRSVDVYRVDKKVVCFVGLSHALPAFCTAKELFQVMNVCRNYVTVHAPNVGNNVIHTSTERRFHERKIEDYFTTIIVTVAS